MKTAILSLLIIGTGVMMSACKTNPTQPNPTDPLPPAPTTVATPTTPVIITLQPAPPVPPPAKPGEPQAYIPPAPAIRGFLEGKYFMLLADMTYTLGTTDISVTVPKGFVTDFASVPKSLWSFGLTPHGRHSRAAVIHDYLYWAQGCTRAQADNIMIIAMQESSVGPIKKTMLSQGVQKFGKRAWKENKRDKEAGNIRVIPEGYWEVPPTFGWLAYNKFLKDNEVSDAVHPDDLEYCELGDSTQVPQGTEP